VKSSDEKDRNMPARLQVTCINKTDRYDAHERIKNIGGDGWKHADDDAILPAILDKAFKGEL
jgi:hypothetical protein